MKLSEVVFLEVEEVERAHDSVLLESGGAHGVRDRGLLESAVAAPRTTLWGEPAYPRLALMGAVLAHGLAKNHPFVDGNKRIAHVAARVFLGINGYELLLPVYPWADYFEGVASGSVSREDLAGLFACEMGGDEIIEG